MNDASPTAPAADRRSGAASDGPRTPLWKRIALAFASFLVTALALEAVVRIAVPPPTPIQIRPGVYASQIPLVTGRQNVIPEAGRPLERKKRDGEIRIFVFGESSVQGAPWAYTASPPAMLYDHLHARMPERDITVVNMGRGSAMMRDSYYYLTTIERFDPDFILFYQGANDGYFSSLELCMPAVAPRLHAAWRWLVERSRLAWAARVLGPSVYSRAFSASNQGEYTEGGIQLCSNDEGFRGWADVLVTTAKRTGARVLVTTPVENPLYAAEAWHLDKEHPHTKREESYTDMLRCVLSLDCDLVSGWEKQRKVTGYQSAWVYDRDSAWMDIAARHEVPVVDFNAYLRDHAKGGLSPQMFAEEVHLTLEGIWQLAWLWSREIEAGLGGAPRVEGAPPPLDEEHYLAAVVRRWDRSAPCILLESADIYLRNDLPLIGAFVLRTIVERETRGRGGVAWSRAGLTAQLLMGRMRQDLGMDHGLPPELAALLPEIDIERVGRQIQEQRACAAVGGPRLQPVKVGPNDRMPFGPLPEQLRPR